MSGARSVGRVSTDLVGPSAGAPAPAPAAPGPTGRPRLRGVDVLRGLAVVGMLLVDDRGNGSIAAQLHHEAWDGLHVADVVFPVFLLVVGVSMPFSRRADRPRAALLRVAKLAVLGCLLVAAKHGWGGLGPGVLGHIAGGYLLCWLLLRLPRAAQLPVAVAGLAGLTAASLLAGTGTGRSWGSAVDGVLGLPLSAEAPHAYLGSALTVYLGVLAGRVLQAAPGRPAVVRLVAGGSALLVAGLALHAAVPLNKRLWSPSFVLVTGGIALLALALVHWLVDGRGVHRAFRPAEVLGLNAIVAFVFSELVFRAVLSRGVQPAVDRWVGSLVGTVASAWLYPAAAITVIWAVCAGLARRGVVVRI